MPGHALSDPAFLYLCSKIFIRMLLIGIIKLNDFMSFFPILRFYFVVLLLILLPGTVSATTPPDDDELHELTLYVIPTMHPLDWSSPASLYKTMISCYGKTIFLADNYLLGHLAVRINTPLLEKPMLVAMTSGDKNEKLKLILKERIGFGILGAYWKGRLEPEKELNHMLKVYEKRKKLAFLKYRLNKAGMKRILTFIEQYAAKPNGVYSPSSFYGGTLWPLYHNEGSGCSNFGVAMLELAGLTDEEVMSWEMKQKVPMDIIGGAYNNGNKVKFSSILKAGKWAETGEANVDWIEYQVFEPSLMFDWVIANHAKNRDDYQPVDENGIPGVYFDGRNAVVDVDKPIFTSRPKPNLFVERFLQKQLPQDTLR